MSQYGEKFAPTRKIFLPTSSCLGPSPPATVPASPLPKTSRNEFPNVPRRQENSSASCTGLDDDGHSDMATNQVLRWYAPATATLTVPEVSRRLGSPTSSAARDRKRKLPNRFRPSRCGAMPSLPSRRVFDHARSHRDR